MRFWGTAARLTASLVGLALVACSTGGKPRGENEYLMAATLWLQTSAENRALAYQAYQVARDRFDRDLADRRAKGKRAIVVDVDETVLDNAPFQSRVALSDGGYPTGWREWVSQASAPAIAGAVDFLSYAHSKGARIFYITNRLETDKKATQENLRQAGFPDVSDETVICRTAEATKEARRQQVAKGHRIVLLVGDNLNDFSDLFAGKNVADRMKAVDSVKNEFGTRFIMLPNPVYGDWESAIYGHRANLTSEEKARLRRAALEPFAGQVKGQAKPAR